jgi:uncharacterized coiled-coil protein SlyX
MSIDTKQIIHIASEVVIIGGITAFFINKTNTLSDQIEELSCKLQQQNDVIQQQNEIIQNHDNIILKLLNTVNILVQENEKAKDQQQCSIQPPKNISIKNEKILKKSEPLSIPLSNVKLPQTINSSKQVLIMMPNPVKKVNRVEETRVEEIIDDDNTSNIPDNTSAILDEELEEELRELDNEELDNELKDDEDDEV